MKFYIQKNLSEKDINDLTEIFKNNNLEYELFYHIPFDDFYPLINKSKKAFLYAASSVTDKAFNDDPVKNGVFSHTKDINLYNFFINSKEMMWSNPIYMGSFKDFSLNHEEIFIRPLMDSKWLAGTVMSKIEYLEWIQKLKKMEFDFNEPILVSNVDYPQDEYRLFFINHKFSTGSQYKRDYEMFFSRKVPESIVELGKNFMNNNINNLPSSFVIDIGENKSKIGIIEVNGINNSGFYHIDKEKLIKDLINS